MSSAASWYLARSTNYTVEHAVKILRRSETAARCGNVATITVDRWADDPRYAHLNFPKKVQLGANSCGFVEAEITAWLEARAAERGARAGDDDERPP